MPKENTTRYAVLGILSISPGSGYDVKKLCDTSISYFWNENYGHIYPVLKQLEKEGLVTMTTEQNPGRPQRNIYAITEAGTKELNAWLELPVQNHPVRSELLFKIFFSKDLPVRTVREKLEHAAQMHKGMLKEFDTIEAWIKQKHGGQRGSHLWLATLRYGQRMSQATIEWCEETLRNPEIGGTGPQSEED
jgi:PadR family transcriptional regulator, regulatory protein AphA